MLMGCGIRRGSPLFFERGPKPVLARTAVDERTDVHSPL